MLRIVYLLLLTVFSVNSEESWDIAVITKDTLNFYLNDRKIYSESVFANNTLLTALTYDAVYNNLWFTDSKYIYKYDVASKKSTVEAKIAPKKIGDVAFDPVKEMFFWTDILTKSIYWISFMDIQIKQDDSRNDRKDNLLIEMGDDKPLHIAVDSCRGYIYWTQNHETKMMKPTIERARFNGTDREVIVNNDIVNPVSLAIDQNTKKIFWADKRLGKFYSIESADLNGENRKTLLKGTDHEPYSLTISIDFIYWVNNKTIWKLPKNHTEGAQPTKHIDISYLDTDFGIAANYPISKQIGQNECEAISNILQNNSQSLNTTFQVPKDGELFLGHGNNAALSEWDCKLGYIGEKCDISVCYNFCVHGDCSLTKEGQAQCTCKRNFVGDRCEVDVCRGFCLNDGECSLNVYNEPVCFEDYEGLRCEMLKLNTTTKEASIMELANESIVRLCRRGDEPSTQQSEPDACHNYCLNGGNCFLDQNMPVCHCYNNYSGSRCETLKQLEISLKHYQTDACFNFCLNEGYCSIDLVEETPVCHCSNDYHGSRCEILKKQEISIQQYEIDACYNFCLNEGYCSIDLDQETPVCHCINNYYGSRCETLKKQELSIHHSEMYTCYNFCLNEGYCSIDLVKETPVCHCLNNYYGSRCEILEKQENLQCSEIDACYNFCLNDGYCSMDLDQETPVCHCSNNYYGSRCETLKKQEISIQHYEIDACYNFCLNGGYCLIDLVKETPVCHCSNNYYGSRCETLKKQENLQCSETDACYNFCLNDGYCSMDLDQKTPVCHCLNNYYGTRCEFPQKQEILQQSDREACYNYCLNNGNCSLDLNQKPICDCLEIYNGSRCEIPLDQIVVCDFSPTKKRPETDACHNYCLNGGNCSLDQNMPVCYCYNSYSGSRCETQKKQEISLYEMDACYNFCLNEGYCSIDLDQETPVCHCSNDYYGSRCETPKKQEISLQRSEIDACYNFCLNEGYCSIDLNEKTPVCHCLNNYYGSRCEILIKQEVSQQTGKDLCYNYCLNNGNCSLDQDQNMPICDCVTSYNGSRCEIPIHQISICDFSASNSPHINIASTRSPAVIVFGVLVGLLGLSCAGLIIMGLRNIRYQCTKCAYYRSDPPRTIDEF